jgi:hypothetical protein
MNNKKSQAALEFLTTYSWAIMTVLVVIGAVTYYLVDFTRTIPDECIIDANPCGSFNLVKTNNEVNVSFEFTNPEHENINFTSANITFERSTLGSSSTCSFSPESIAPGRKAVISCTLNENQGLITRNVKERIRLTIEYKIESRVFPKFAQGEMYVSPIIN